MWEWLKEAVNKVIEWGVNLTQKGNEAAKNLFDNVINTIKELPNKMLEIGKNIVEGLWNGIVGAKDWIKNKVGEFAKGILDGMKESLGIHSPSRLFRDEVGKYIALGVGEGFNKNIDSVYNAMKNKLNLENAKLNSNLVSDLSVANDIGSSNTKAQTISPVIVNFYPQQMTEGEIDRAFNYINRKFGLAY